MSNPLVSICIPTYNGSAFLGEAMESIKNQTYPRLEVIVSDDSSKDATLAIVQEFKAAVSFPVTIVSHTPQGIGANWNNTIKHAKGEYIKFLFQDDVLLPECIEEMASVLQEYKKVGMVASKRTFMVQNEMKTFEIKKWMEVYGDLQAHLNLPEKPVSILNKSLFKSQAFYTSPLNKIGEPSVVMFRRSIVSKIGFFDTELKQILDYEYWYRILKKHPIAIINKPLVRFRLHGAQATNTNRNLAIPDYQLYPKILYNRYFWLLNPSLRIKLFKKYSKGFQFYLRIKNKLKKFLKSIE